ncbi:MAG: rod shape-determining protein RodA [Saprospiraceae bacterium]|nr:rod shape-determining protein RodA [Saprospiraceae bacterium]
MRDRRNIFVNIDWVMILLYLLLVLIGWVNIYAAVYNEDHQSIFDFSQSYGKQMLWIGTSILLALIILLVDSKFFSSFSYVIYGILILMLIAVLLVGKEIAGSKSWFGFGDFGIQPSEFAKFATNLAIARYLSVLNIDMKNIKTKIFTIALLALPAGLIFLQNDTGSAIVYSAFIFVMYREGLSGNILIIGVIAVILFVLALLINTLIIISFLAGIAIIIFLLIKKNQKNILKLIGLLVITSAFVLSIDYVFEHVLEDHQKIRIDVLLGKNPDLKGAGYNVNQSKIAIGSGGFSGKGFLQGTQTKFNFVPEQSTDFIFCTIGEEWGFLGSSLVVILFVGLLIRIIYIAERQRSQFSRIYGYGVASILFFHFSINIGMTLGLVPVIGIPLPFFSYGGSSLWAFTILLFIFIKQDSYRLELL